ncbi:hypothetical protein GW17_00002131, partial [Ensete ventricosum]
MSTLDELFPFPLPLTGFFLLTPHLLKRRDNKGRTSEESVGYRGWDGAFPAPESQRRSRRISPIFRHVSEEQPGLRPLIADVVTALSYLASQNYNPESQPNQNTSRLTTP